MTNGYDTRQYNEQLFTENKRGQIRRKVSRKRSMLSGDGRKLYSEAK